MDSGSPEIIFAVLTFRPLGGAEQGGRFFEILQTRSQGVLIPEFINQKLVLEPKNREKLAHLWRQGGAIRLDRKTPPKMYGMVTIPDESVRTAVPSSVYVSIRISDPAGLSVLHGLVQSGDSLYQELSACYGAIFLPWTPIIGALASLARDGIPGVGWATWLGPEYEEIIRFSNEQGLDISRMLDAGLRILLPMPDRLDEPNRPALDAYINLLREVGSDALQNVTSDKSRSFLETVQDSSEARLRLALRAVRIPKFRFR